MCTTRTCAVPMTWDDPCTDRFFRTTARLFSPEFCFGASVLLASYDDEAAEDHVVHAVEPEVLYSRREPVPVVARR